MNMPVPSSQASAMLFGRYQSNQQMIGTRVSTAIGGFWTSMVDPEHFSESWRRLEPIVRGIIDTHYEMSAADASDYYRLSRAVSGFYGATVPGVYLDQDYLSGFVETMGVNQFYHFLDGGGNAVVASQKAQRALQGASVRVVLNGGRGTVTKAASGDDIATGWERIVESKPCSYCSRLAASDGIHKAESDPFHAHDRCHCVARVVFRGQGSANVDLASEWTRATAGKSGKDAIAAWDQYWSDKNGNSSVDNNGQRAELPAAPAQEEAGNAAVTN